MTLTSQTLIDHFATDKPKLIINFGVFTTDCSDHDLIFGIRKVSSRVREPKIIKSRQLKIMIRLNSVMKCKLGSNS